jgi:RNA polymerase sigma-70 factor (ECF subfamily)
METYIAESTPVLNKKALTRIYEQHSTPLFRYAYRLLGDRDLAEDCVSEVFSRFLHAVQDRHGPRENVRAYLYRMAHNWVTDQYRRRTVATVPLDGELTADMGKTPIQEFVLEQERQKIRAALMSLPSEQRRVIELRFLEEWSHEAVASELGKTVEATRALQHRALENLRRLLIDDHQKDGSSIQRM